MGFNDKEEVDVFDLGAGQSKPEDYGTETNMFAVEFDVSESKPAGKTQAAFSSTSSFADDEDEFAFSGGGSGLLDDDDEFPEAKEGFFAKIKGMFAKPDFDDSDMDLDVGGDFSDSDEFPEEKEGFFAKIKGMFAKPDFDDSDMDLDVGGDFSDSDEFPEEKEGFFAKIKGMFSKPEGIDDFEDSLLDDYKPVLGKDDDDIFDISSSPASAVAAPRAEPEFEAKPRHVAAVKAKQPEEEGDEFDIGASVPPPVPAPLPPPVFNRFAHVCIYVKNLNASIDFYTKLGFTKCFAFNKNGRLFGVYLEFGGGNFIELFEDAQRGSGAARGSLAHFCLETPDIDAAIKSLASRGIQHTPKKLGSDHTYQIWLKDPDGNDFEIHQYTRESSQITGRDVEADW